MALPRPESQYWVGSEVRWGAISPSDESKRKKSIERLKKLLRDGKRLAHRHVHAELYDLDGAILTWDSSQGDKVGQGDTIAWVERWGLRRPLVAQFEGKIRTHLIRDGERVACCDSLAIVRLGSGAVEQQNQSEAYVKIGTDTPETLNEKVARQKRALTAIGVVWLIGAAGCLAAIVAYLFVGGPIAPAVGAGCMATATLALLWGKKFVAS